MTMALSLKGENINSGSHPCRPIHSSLFLFLNILRSLLPQTFPPVCIFLGPPSSSLSLQLSASLTRPQSVYGRWLDLWKGTGRRGAEHLSGGLQSAPPLFLCHCVFQGFWKSAWSVSMFDIRALLTQQTDRRTIRNRDVTIHSQAPRLLDVGFAKLWPT